MKPRDILAAALATMVFSFLIGIPFTPTARNEDELFSLELELTSTATGLSQLFYDRGQGYNEKESVTKLIETTATPRVLRYSLPAGTIRGLRFDPLERAGTVIVSRARVMSSEGFTIQEFTPDKWSPGEQIASVGPKGNGVVITTEPRAFDPSVLINVGSPIVLKSPPAFSVVTIGRNWAPSLIVCEAILLGLVFSPRPIRDRLTAAKSAARRWSEFHPQRAVALVAAIAAIASAWPVVFLGMSFVSPNFGPVALLYQKVDTIPGSKSLSPSGVQGSDVGAVMWMHLPLTKVAHRAIFEDGELPLWNRYNATGAPLLGQSQSMLGDPLHMLLPLLFDGAAWAWDLKYVLAKWLLACGLGLAAWQATRHLPSALLVAVMADFIGFFVYRVNHPAIFSLCYAPWILYFWQRAVQASDLRHTARWSGGLIVANLAEMASGTAKEAYMLLAFLNLTGFLMLVLARDPLAARIRKLAVMSCAGVLFVLISAPIWISFFVALKSAFTVYDQPEAQQVPAYLVAGLFDEILYRPFNADFLFFPSASFVYLLGILGFLVYLRESVDNRIGLAVALGAIIPFSIAFGIIPGSWIVKIPLLANVVHVGNTFSCVVIIHLGVLAGCGFAVAARRLGGKSGRFDIAIGLLLLAGILVPYVAAYFKSSPTIFVKLDFAAILVATIGFILVARRILINGRLTPATGILAATCLLVLGWRFALHHGAGFPGYVLNPPARADFSAPSSAVQKVLAERDPFRATGIDDNLLPGWSDTYNIEGYAGPEPLINKRYREFMDAADLLRVWGWRYVVEIQSIPKFRPIYDFLNIRYYFQANSDATRYEGMLTSLVRADTDVYQSDSPWPRAFFTDTLLRYNQPADLVTLINSRPGKPFAAVQSSDDGIPALPPVRQPLAAAIPAHDYKLTANRTSFDVDAPTAGVIVLHEAWGDSDYRLLVNGKPASYFRVNHLFRGIKVDLPGSYHIEYEYWPPLTTLSLVLCAAGFVLAAATGWLVFRPSSPRPQPASPAGS